jgi:hypothetical protein
MRSLLPLSVLCLIPLFAQAPQEGGRKGGGGRAPENLKVLKLQPGESIIPTMRAYSAALGVRCDFCHVQGNFASDEKRPKETARRMIGMVQDIDAKYFAGKERVTCYTCHHGEEEPKRAPAPAAPGQ